VPGAGAGPLAAVPEPEGRPAEDLGAGDRGAAGRAVRRRGTAVESAARRCGTAAETGAGLAYRGA
jgi:hypothetical protein